MPHLTYQYCLDLRRGQHRALDRILEMQRQLYNAALEERIGAYRKTGRSPSLVDQMRSLTAVRADDPEGYGALPVALSRWPLKKLDLAFEAFFARVAAKKGKAGFPRFRGKPGWRSFGFRELHGVRLVGDRLKFSAFGRELSLRMPMHRPLPVGAAVKSCVFTKDGRRWSAALQIEAPAAATVHPFAGRAVGLDWGVESLLTLSDGTFVPNRRPGRAAAHAVAEARRTLAGRRKGSRRREKAKARLRALQRRLARRRRTYLHQVSADLTRRFGMIAAEDLSLRGLTASAKGTIGRPGRNVRQKAGLNREILDTSPGTLLAMLAYKAERAGGRFAAVDPRNTSIECSGCGTAVPKDLGRRRHECPRCGLDLHRDVNAARAILARAVVGPWSGIAVDPNGGVAAVAPVFSGRLETSRPN